MVYDVKVPGYEPFLIPLIKAQNPSLDEYLKMGGYKGLMKAVKMTPDEVIKVVKDSGLRGRGGAGFPTGVKWEFIPKDAPRKYLVCNADEGEPGTFKDRYLLRYVPHLVLEGIAIASWANDAHKAFIYVRGEYWEEAEVIKMAVKEARDFLGKDTLGFSLDVEVVSGAGAYVVGEETGLLNSLEGKRGNPRSRPPFPATSGYLGEPTVINNVETLSCVPFIVERGADWFKKIGTEKSTGGKLFCLSGCVKKPGLYELPLGFPLSELIELAGGTRCESPVKAVIVGGTSTAPLSADELSTPLDYESLMERGGALGTGAIIVICERTCPVWVCLKALKFYAEESCGQCIPCREGLNLEVEILEDLEMGKANEEDLKTLEDVAKTIGGKTICALSDAGSTPILAFLKKFENEFLEHIEGGCPYGRKSCQF